MSWLGFFNRFLKRVARWLRYLTQPSSAALVDDSLDHKLISRLRPRAIPTWSQLRYLGALFSRRELKLFWSAVLVAGISLVALLGYFTYQHSEFSPTQGGDYAEALVGQPVHINPLFAPGNEVDQDLAALIYRGLFAFAGNWEITPDLAESVTISPDEKVYDITLRPGLTWSDGEALTAEDIVFTWELIQNPEVESHLRSAFAGVEVGRLNERQVRFTLKEPFAPFLTSLTVGILPAHLWGSIPPNQIRFAKLNLQPVGSGPWQFSKLTKNDQGEIQTYTLLPNERYTGPRPYLEKLTFKFFPTYPEAFEALRTRGVDALNFVPPSLQEQLSNKQFQLFRYQLPQYTALFFNQASTPWLQPVEVRRALNLAIDKSALVKEVMRGNGRVAHSPILPGQIGFTEPTPTLLFNPAESNTLLDKRWSRLEPETYFKMRVEELKQTATTSTNATTTPTAVAAATDEELKTQVRSAMDPNQLFYRADQNRRPIKLTITTLDIPEYIAVAENLALQWQQIGIKTTVQPLNSRQIIREGLQNRRYQVLLYGEISGADPDPFPFWHSSQVDYPGLNLARWVNRAADKLLEEGRATKNQARRREIYQKFQTLITEEVPAVFLYTPEHVLAVRRGVKGVVLNTTVTPADRFASLPRWYRKTRWQWK